MNQVPPAPPANIVANLRAQIIHIRQSPRTANPRSYGSQRIGHALESDLALKILFTEMPNSALSRLDLEDMFNYALAPIYAGTGRRTYYQLNDRWANRGKGGRAHRNWAIANLANSALDANQQTVKQGVLNDLCAAAAAMNFAIDPGEMHLQGLQPGQAVAGNAAPAIQQAPNPPAMVQQPLAPQPAGAAGPSNAIANVALQQGQQPRPNPPIAGPQAPVPNPVPRQGPDPIAPAVVDDAELDMDVNAVEVDDQNDFQMPEVEYEHYANAQAHENGQYGDQGIPESMLQYVDSGDITVFPSNGPAVDGMDRMDRVGMDPSEAPQIDPLDAGGRPQGHYTDHGLTLVQAAAVFTHVFMFLNQAEAENMVEAQAGDVGQVFLQLEPIHSRLSTWDEGIRAVLQYYG